jgi:hypothetical protein
MFPAKLKNSIILSFIILILALIASAGGLLIEDLYRDNALVKCVWRANDMVTLFLAIPLMAVALLFTIRGSIKAQLIWMGTLWYMVYNYIFYMYAAAFNIFFLIYVALFILSLYALIFAMINTDAKTISRSFHSRIPVKWISGFMFFFAISLGIPWIAMSINFIFTSQVPAAILQTGHPTGVVFATDLSLLVSCLVLGAILLWKHKSWGYIISIILMVKGILYSLVLIIGGIFVYKDTGTNDPLTPLYILLGAGCLVCLGLFLGYMNHIEKQPLK